MTVTTIAWQWAAVYDAGLKREAHLVVLARDAPTTGIAEVCARPTRDRMQPGDASASPLRQDGRHDFRSFLPWRGAAAGLVVALGWAGLFRLLRRPELAGLGAGLGLAVGWVLTLGLLTGSPRQLPERLPALAVGGVLVGLVLVLAGRRGWLGAVLAALGVFGAAWWLAGGPLTQADLRRVGIVLLALAALGAAVLLALRGPVPAAAAMALLAAGLWLFGPPGPWFVLALVGVAAALGALPAGPWGSAGPAGGDRARALAAGPVLARGGAADWLMAAAPLAALWIGPARAAGSVAGPASRSAGPSPGACQSFSFGCCIAPTDQARGSADSRAR